MKYNTGDVLKCEICNNVIEVKEAGPGTIICCGQPMSKIDE